MSKAWTHSIRGLSVLLAMMIAFGPVARAHAMTNPVSAEFEGRVLRVTDGMPAANVAVRLVGVESLKTVAELQSDASGRVHIAGVEPGQYMITIDAPDGYLLAGAPLVTLVSGRSTAVDLDLAPVQEQDWWDYAIKCVVESVDGSTLKLKSGIDLMTDASTEWLGDLVSAAAIDQSLGQGQNVCVAYEGLDQGDKNFLGTAVHAMTCTDAIADAFQADQVAEAVYSCDDDEFPVESLLAALLGAAAIALGITGVIDDGEDPEVVTQ